MASRIQEKVLSRIEIRDTVPFFFFNFLETHFFFFCLENMGIDAGRCVGLVIGDSGGTSWGFVVFFSVKYEIKSLADSEVGEEREH